MNQFEQPQMNNPYASLQPPPYVGDHAEPTALKHSGMGIASFILALLAGLSVITLIVIAGFMEASTPGGVDEESPAIMMLGLLVCAGSIASVVGLALGIAGCVQSNRKKVFAILGVTLNALILLGVGGLMIIGMAAP